MCVCEVLHYDNTGQTSQLRKQYIHARGTAQQISVQPLIKYTKPIRHHHRPYYSSLIEIPNFETEIRYG
jgi:hypothetical protein